MKDNFDAHKWFKNQYLSEGVYTDTDGPNALSIVDDIISNLSKSNISKTEIINLLKDHIRHLTGDYDNPEYSASTTPRLK